MSTQLTFRSLNIFFFSFLIYTFIFTFTIKAQFDSNFESVDPKPLALHSSVIVEDNLIIHGGINPYEDDVYKSKALSDTWVFNIVKKSWLKLKPNKDYNFPLKFHSSVAIDNHMYTYTAASYNKSPLIILDTSKWTWFDLPNPLGSELKDAKRIGSTLLATDKQLLLFGGMKVNSDDTLGNITTETTSSRNIDENAWIERNPGTPTYFHSGCYMSDKKVAIYFGGKNDNDYVTSIQTASITFGSGYNVQFKFDYPEIDNKPGNAIGATLSCIGDKAILIGGGDSDWQPKPVFIYYLDMSQWNTTTFKLRWEKVHNSGGPSKLMGHSASVKGNDIYIYGGVQNNDINVYKLDSTNWSWTPLSAEKSTNNNPNGGGNSNNGSTENNGGPNTTVIIAIVSALFGVLMMGAIVGVGLRHWRRKNRKLQKETPPTINETKSSSPGSGDSATAYQDSNDLSPGRYSNNSVYNSNSPSLNGQYLSPIKSSSESKLLSSPQGISRPISRNEDGNEKWTVAGTTTYSIFSGQDDATSSIAPVPIKYMRPLSPLDSKKINQSGNLINHTRSLSEDTADPSLAEPASPLLESFPTKSNKLNIMPSLSINTNVSRIHPEQQNDERISPLDRISRLAHTIDSVNLFSRSPDELSTPTSSIQNWPYREDIAISRAPSHLREIHDSTQLFQNLSNIQSTQTINSNLSQRSIPGSLNFSFEPILAKKLGGLYKLNSPIIFVREDVFTTTALEISTSNSVTILIYLNKELWEKETEMLQILEGPYVPHLKDSFVLSEEPNKSCYALSHAAPGIGLIDLLRQQKYPLSDDDIRQIVKQITQLLDFCHARGVVITDLQPSDLCFSGDSISNRIMLTKIDRCLIEGDTIKRSKSPRYCPPELAPLFLKNSTKPLSASPSMDMWSLGCFVYELYVRKPYMGIGTSEIEVMKFLSSEKNNYYSNGIYWDNDYTLVLPELNHLPIESADAIKSLLRKNPSKRANASNILESDFLSQCKSQKGFSPNISTEKFLSIREPLSDELFSLAATLRKQTVTTSEIQAPRLIIILPTLVAGNSWKDPSLWDEHTFKIHFLCEASLGLHFTDHPGFPLNRPHDFISNTGPLLSVVSQLCAFYMDSNLLEHAHKDIINVFTSSSENDVVSYFEILCCVIESFCSNNTMNPTASVACEEMYNSRQVSDWIPAWINEAREALLACRHIALKETRLFIQDNMEMTESLELGVHYCKYTTNQSPNLSINNRSMWHAWLCNEHSLA